MARCIYIVEDDAAVRSSLHGLLSLRSDRIVCAFSCGDSFLAEAASLAPGLLLLDLHLPGTGGLGVLEILRRRHGSRFSTLILTGSSANDMIASALAAGAIGFIEKPYEAQLLMDSIDSAFLDMADTTIDLASAAQRRVGCAN